MGKAFRFYQHGGPEVMQWEDVDLPPPAAGQVRMRNIAVAVNYRDVLIRRGSHEVRTFPSGIGLESAGVVEAVGPDVTDFATGDRIACVAGPDGAYAEARNVPAARAVKLPDGIDERTAAAMMIRGMTARYLLHDTYPVKPGDAILVHAAAGGVGLILCQWAKYLGATVIGTVSSDDKADVARAHGCDHPIVYTREDFAARVREITNGEGVAAVYDFGRADHVRRLAAQSAPAWRAGVLRRSLRRPRARAAAQTRPAGLDLPHASEPARLHRDPRRPAQDRQRSVRDGEVRQAQDRDQPHLCAA